jgi:hypothetical protein
MTVTLAEPPSLNKMLDLAKQRVRVGKRLVPIVYDRAKNAYELQAIAEMRTQGFFAPRVPWRRWRIEAVEMRRHQLLDPIEMLASLKFPVDALVKGRYVQDDGPDYLLSIPLPVQKIDRSNRGITLTIFKVEE